MKKVSLSGSVRKSVGKKDAKLMRREGLVPCVVYGNKEQIHFSVKEANVNKVVFTPNTYIIDLDVEGKKALAFIKEIQVHPVTDKVLHVDFQEVVEGKEVKINIPVILTGLAKGVQNGGKLIQNFRSLTALALVDKLPDTIEIDVTALKIGGKIRVNEIEIDGVSFLNPEGAVVAAVQMARGASEDDEEETEEVAEEAAEA